MNTKFIKTALAISCCFTISCTDYTVEDPNFLPPDIVTNENYGDEEIIASLPEAGDEKPYEPSVNKKSYRPIKVKYSSQYPPIEKWDEDDTRILYYLSNYTPEIKTYKEYSNITNKYGSLVTGDKYEATGRFYVKKIGDRWKVIDPEGFPNYIRIVNSLRKGSSDRNKQAWDLKFGDDSKWLAVTQTELASIGFHGSGAFCTDTYDKIQKHNKDNPASPITLAPSFGFLTRFKNDYQLGYPNNSSDNAIALVINENWDSFCEEYVKAGLAPYKGDKNVVGFFSDNEISFKNVLKSLWKINDIKDPYYKFAKEFMDSKGANTVTTALDNEFEGILAEKYYKGVKNAVKKFDPGLMYLGTRLHGSYKYIREIVTAAGKYCDIVSINYYSRWSPELDTKIKEWEEWSAAPFMVTEFYTKGVEDSDLNNQSGAGLSVPSQNERAYAYQHFTLGLLEAKNCVGWNWFKYQDDDGDDNSGKPANKGIYDNNYEMFPYLAKFMQQVNYNVYNLIEFFDK